MAAELSRDLVAESHQSRGGQFDLNQGGIHGVR